MMVNTVGKNKNLKPYCNILLIIFLRNNKKTRVSNKSIGLYDGKDLY